MVKKRNGANYTAKVASGGAALRTGNGWEKWGGEKKSSNGGPPFVTVLGVKTETEGKKRKAGPSKD